MATRPGWLEESVFYQIFLPSFFDSNDDGIGDLRGITQKLDYIETLGCNAILISPCFESPFSDAGYDISDHYSIAPRYGTQNDMKKLLMEAGRRGIRVILDFVPGFTSIEHPWFKESCKPEPNRYSHWYIWTTSFEEAGEGELTTVSGYAERNGNYVANHFYFEPTLNYGFARPDPAKSWQLSANHPDIEEMKKELTEVMRYWLDMGIDGLRMDLSTSLVKNDPDERGTVGFFSSIGQMFDREYPEAVLVSEWGSPQTALKAGFHADSYLFRQSNAYTSLFRAGPYLDDRMTESSFFDPDGRGNILTFLNPYMEDFKRTKRQGFISIPTGHQDVPRLSLGRSTEDIRLAFVFLLTLPGIPSIYYGDEIGMRYIGDLVSKEGGYWRTGSRTPMQWSRGPNAGFSGAERDSLYLPVDTDDDAPCVDEQMLADDSILATVRNLIRIRKQNPALQASGDFVPIYAEPNRYPFIYLRSSGRNKVLVVINPSKRAATAQFKLPGSETFVELKMLEGIRLRENKGIFTVKMDGQSYGIFSC